MSGRENLDFARQTSSKPLVVTARRLRPTQAVKPAALRTPAEFSFKAAYGPLEETEHGGFRWPRYISMDETHVCVLDREGVVVRKTASTADVIAGELAKAPRCRRIVFETGRMAPILFHGLSQLGFPVTCIESRQAQ